MSTEKDLLAKGDLILVYMVGKPLVNVLIAPSHVWPHYTSVCVCELPRIESDDKMSGLTIIFLGSACSGSLLVEL